MSHIETITMKLKEYTTNYQNLCRIGLDLMGLPARYSAMMHATQEYLVI
jgi:hypothetical protein